MRVITHNLFGDREFHLPIRFFSACTAYDQESIRRPHGAPDFSQILICTKGEGAVVCGGREYPLKRGGAFFTAMHVPIEYRNKGGFVTAFLAVQGEGVRAMQKHFGCDGFLYRESVSVEKYTHAIGEIIDHYYRRRREGELSAMCYALLVDFFEEGDVFSNPLDQVVLHIERHFNEPLTLADLSLVAGCSESKLCHDFKRARGKSVIAYLRDFRLDYAHKLLFTDRTATTKSAALSSGFSDVSYFCRAYRARFGNSPQGDREQSRTKMQIK